MLNVVVWSSLSEIDFANVLDYLESKWTVLVCLNFIESLDNCIIQIQKNPAQFPFKNKKLNIRKCVVSKHNTIYFRFINNQIQILRIYDNRQNPDNLKFY